MSNSESFVRSRASNWLARIFLSMSEKKADKIATEQQSKATEDVRLVTETTSPREASKLIKKRLSLAIGRWRVRKNVFGQEKGHGAQQNLPDTVGIVGGVSLRLMMALNYVLAGGVAVRETGQEIGIIPDASQLTAINFLLQLPERIAGSEAHLAQKVVDMLVIAWPIDAVHQLQNAINDVVSASEGAGGAEVVSFLIVTGVLSALAGGKLVRDAFRRFEYSATVGENVENKLVALEQTVRNLQSNRQKTDEGRLKAETTSRSLFNDKRIQDLLNYAQKLGYGERVERLRTELQKMIPLYQQT